MTSTLRLTSGATIKTNSVHRYQIVVGGRIVGRADSLASATKRAAKHGTRSADPDRASATKASFDAGDLSAADYCSAMDAIGRVPAAVVYDIETGLPVGA